MTVGTLDVESIGGSGGYLTSRGFNGQRLTGIQAWAENKDNKKIRGLRIWMKGGSTETDVMFGTSTGTASARFTVKVTETITSLQLWDNGSKAANGTRLGTIEMKLSSGRKFTFGVQKTQQAPKTVQPHVGSGICVGYKVRSYLDIDAFGLEFLLPIRSSEITDVKYHVWEHLGVVEPTNLDTFSQTNNSSSPISWSWSDSLNKTVSSEWSLDLALVIGASVSVTAGITVLAQVTGEFHWQLSAALHTGSSTSTSRTRNWSVSRAVPPNGYVIATARSGHGTTDLYYTAISTDGGYVLTYSFDGQYRGVEWSSAHVTVDGDTNAKVSTGVRDCVITGQEDYSEADVSIAE